MEIILPSGYLPIRAIGVDIDGVLRDTGHASFVAMRDTAVALGGKPLTHQDFVRNYGNSRFGLYRDCGVVATDEEILTAFRKQATFKLPAPYKDVLEFLNFAKKLGLPVFSVSSSRVERAVGWLETHGLASHFCQIVAGVNEKTEHMRDVCAKLHAEPEEVAYVGDLGADIRDAIAARMIPVGITRGYDTTEALLACGAQLVVENFHVLMGRLLPR